MDDLTLLYLKHAQTYYRKNGEPTSELSCQKIALRYLVKLHGRTRVREFGPLAFREVRQAMIDDGHCRISINKHAGGIRRMFKWAVSLEHCSPEIMAGLQSVEGLRASRTEAKESEPVKPVPMAFVEAIEPFVSRQV